MTLSQLLNGIIALRCQVSGDVFMGIFFLENMKSSSDTCLQDDNPDVSDGI